MDVDPQKIVEKKEKNIKYLNNNTGEVAERLKALVC